MIETNARGRNQAAGGAARRAGARPAVRRAEPGPSAEPDPPADPDPRADRSPGGAQTSAQTSAQSSNMAPAEARDGAERRRAARYLDLWERHVSGAAHGGRGIAAPWFSR